MSHIVSEPFALLLRWVEGRSSPQWWQFLLVLWKRSTTEGTGIQTYTFVSQFSFCSQMWLWRYPCHRVEKMQDLPSKTQLRGSHIGSPVCSQGSFCPTRPALVVSGIVCYSVWSGFRCLVLSSQILTAVSCPSACFLFICWSMVTKCLVFKTSGQVLGKLLISSNPYFKLKPLLS